MRPEVHHRRPAARHGHAIAGNLVDHRAFARLQAKRHAGHAGLALDLSDGLAFLNADALGLGLGPQSACAFGAGIDDCRNGKPRIHQRNRGAIGIVVVGDNHGAVAHGNAPVHEVIAHGPCQKNARQVVARKGQRPLDRTRGGDRLLGADAPQAVARAFQLGVVIGQPLVAEDIAVIIDARAHAAGAERHILHLFKRLDGGCHPLGRGSTGDLDTIDNSTPAPLGGLLHHHHARAGLAGLKCRLQPRDAAADHHDIGVEVEMLICIRVAILRRFAEAGRLADEGLVDVLPERTREEEGLIIETRRQEPRENRVDRADIELERRPVVLARGIKPVEKLGRRGALVRLELAALAEVDERVGLFRAARHHAARAVVFERPANHHLIVRQKCGGERIALKALQALAVELELKGAATVEKAATGGKTRAHLNSLHDQPGLLALILSRNSLGGSFDCAE